MSSLKDKAIKVGLSVLISGSLIFLGADMLIKIQKNRSISLRERVYELVLQKYEGKYDTKIGGKDVEVGALGPSSQSDKVRCLYLEVKDKYDKIYFMDLAEFGSAENTFFGRLDYCGGKVKIPEQEFDNYLKLVKEEIGRKS